MLLADCAEPKARAATTSRLEIPPEEGDMPEFIVIPAGSSTATLTIYPVADNVAEGQETVILTLSPDANYNMGQPKTATITIVDTVL